MLTEGRLEKADMKSFDYEEVTAVIEGMGEKRYRARQLYEWIHKSFADSFYDMTNLSKTLRHRLDAAFALPGVKVIKRQAAADGTSKFLMELCDKNAVESVLMKYRHGVSACISTQAGCRMGCGFCASTQGGLKRNLAPSEMLDQIYKMQRAAGERISNIILMGIGEPLDNYDNVLKFIKMISDAHGLNVSQRNITLSTCGLADRIRMLAKEGLAVTLAVSLHAPSDEIRRRMMPVANAYSVSDIMDACRYYVEKTGRRVTFEYSLAAGINDAPEHADMLAKLLNGLNCHVNLIWLNPVEGSSVRRAGREEVRAFKLRLEKNHVNVTIRRELGGDIDAACGQLRNKMQRREAT